jgi:hypothetical protein
MAHGTGYHLARIGLEAASATDVELLALLDAPKSAQRHVDALVPA